MSLIGEALKKAHLEAIRQDGSGAGLAHTPGVAHYRQLRGETRPGWSRILVASNVVLALVVAAIVFWPKNSEDSPAPPPTKLAEQSASRAAVAQPLPRTPLETAETSVDEISATAAPQLAPTAVPPPVEHAPAEPAPPPPAPAPAQSRAVDGLVSGQTYMGSVPVPGGNDLVLNGMSVSGGGGVALVNSRMVRSGDRIGPFTVGTIGDRKVELAYKGITIYLKMP